MDYVLYCVKYINPWHASYLRRGTDNITESGKTSTIKRHGATVEKDEICNVTTRSLKTCHFPVSTKLADGSSITCNLLLTFDEENRCSITSDTEGITASGKGHFEPKGEKKAWGNKDRDALYLDYTINYGIKQVATKDTLVLQTRGTNKMELFTPKYIAK